MMNSIIQTIVSFLAGVLEKFRTNNAGTFAALAAIAFGIFGIAEWTTTAQAIEALPFLAKENVAYGISIVKFVVVILGILSGWKGTQTVPELPENPTEPGDPPREVKA